MTISPKSPASDWICQRELARIFGISERTAASRAKRGDLKLYEHGVPSCGQRKYSRQLVERELQKRWATAIQKQDLIDG